MPPITEQHPITVELVAHELGHALAYLQRDVRVLSLAHDDDEHLILRPVTPVRSNDAGIAWCGVVAGVSALMEQRCKSKNPLRGQNELTIANVALQIGQYCAASDDDLAELKDTNPAQFRADIHNGFVIGLIIGGRPTAADWCSALAAKLEDEEFVLIDHRFISDAMVGEVLPDWVGIGDRLNAG